MNNKKLLPNKPSRSSRRSISKIKPSVKAWVIKAISEESKKPEKQMWEGEPSQIDASKETIKRITFLRKHGKTDPGLLHIADYLEQCENGSPCCSGACPQCGRLFQRFYVRHSRRTIRNIIAPQGSELVALCIVPVSSIVRSGNLRQFSIANFQRRFKTVLDAANIQYGIGGVDFSFNEDRNNQWQPFICPHIYLVTSTDNRESLHRMLKSTFKPSKEIPRPVKLPDFTNNARRRSYSLKMIFKRRISYFKTRNENQKKISRNTSNDTLRASERIELYKYLHQTGFSARVIFRGIKPEVSNSKVRFRKA